MQLRVWRSSLCCLLPNARIGLLHHLFAEVHAHQVVLKDVVVEHILRSLAEVHDPLGNGRWAYAKGHVLRIGRTRRMIITADTAYAAGDKVRIPRILALHED